MQSNLSLNLRTLEFFCAVAEQRNFSRAASTLGVSQSAVSQSINQLEENLGVTLIDRSKRPPTLTVEGKTYLRGVRGILASYHRLEEEVRAQKAKLSGQITIGSIVSVGLSYMPAATEEFGVLHPDVEVNHVFGTSERVVDMVARGEVDFGLVSFARSTKQIAVVPWQREPMRLICSVRHPLAKCHEIGVHQLHRIDMLGFDRELTLRHEIDKALAEVGVEVNVRMEFDNADSMIRAIQANDGIGIVPEAAVRRETADGSLCVVSCREFQMHRPLGMVFRRDSHLGHAASEFGSLLLGRSVRDELSGREKRKSSPADISVVA